MPWNYASIEKREEGTRITDSWKGVERNAL